MKDNKWIKALKYNLLENIVISFLIPASLFAPLTFIVDAIDIGNGGNKYVVIVSIVIFVAIFSYNLCESYYYIEHPEERKKSRKRIGTYGDEINPAAHDVGGFDDSGF